MKRQPSPTLPELPATSRRKRALSEEEHALWESVAKQIKPLRKKPRAAKAPPAFKAPAALPDAETDAGKPVMPPRPLSSAKIVRALKPEMPAAAPPLAPL